MKKLKTRLSLLRVKHSVKLENAPRMMDEDYKHIEYKINRLEQVLEEVDNKAHKFNLWLKGLKEGLEEQDLKKKLETLLTGCLGSETEEEVQLAFAYSLGAVGKGWNKSKDTNIILGFPNGSSKALVLASLWDKPKTVIEGQALTFYSDL